jgi:hypothetical protein
VSDAYRVGTVIYPLGMAQIGDQLYVVGRAPRTVNTTSEVAALDLQRTRPTYAGDAQIGLPRQAARI